MAEEIPENTQWKISVPVFKNTIILKQLGLAFGIPFGLLMIILALTTGQIIFSLYILAILCGLLFLTWLFYLAVYRGQYNVAFVLNDRGAECRTQTKQRKKNRIVNSIAIILGLFSGRPAVAGGALLAESRQQVFIRWKKITKVKYKPKSHTILIRSGLMENIALFCSPDNYQQIEDIVRQKTAHLAI